jgi:hypothetical protein
MNGHSNNISLSFLKTKESKLKIIYYNFPFSPGQFYLVAENTGIYGVL